MLTKNTDQLRQRDLLIIELVSHMAYMQELLEDYDPLGDPDDYHWHRESIRLRSLAAEVLA